jgi:formate dehydrogenase maturation protein FdhE
MNVAHCQCGWTGAPESRKVRWGHRSYCPICGSEAPIKRDACGWCGGYMFPNGTGNLQCEDCFMVQRQDVQI